MLINEILLESDSKLKSRIKKAIDKMDDSNQEQVQTLNRVKNVIYDSILQSTFKEGNIQSRCRPEAYEWFKSKLEAISVPLEDKVYLLKLMNDERYLIPEKVFQKNDNGNLLNYVNSKIKNNSAFKEMATSIWRFKIGGQGGMGPGELFLSLFSQNGKEGSGKKGGDVTVGDWKIELKQGGVVPPGDSGKKIVDKLNTNLKNIAEKEGFIDQLNIKTNRGTDSPNSLSSGWIPDFFKIYSKKNGEQKSKNIFKTYLIDLYGDDATSYVDIIFNNLGTSGVERLLAPMILSMYKKSHEWDSICFVDENFKFVNLTTFENIPNELKFSLKLKRGGDTNAVADGYMVVDFQNKQSTKSPKQVNKTTIRKSKNNLDIQKNQSTSSKNTDSDTSISTNKNVEPKRNERDTKMQEILTLMKTNPSDPLSVAIKRTINQNPTISQTEIIGDVADDLLSGVPLEQVISDRTSDENFYESIDQLSVIKRLISS